jgi:hypothetical protein
MFRKVLLAFFATAVAAALTVQSSLAGRAGASEDDRPNDQGTEVTVIVPVLNVRAAASLRARIVGRLQRGAKVPTLGKSADGLWWKISFRGNDAFIYARYATPSTPVTTIPSPPVPKGLAGFELGGHIRTTDFLDPMKTMGMTWVKIQVVMPGGAPDLSQLINTVHSKGMKILIGAIGDRSRASDGEYHKEFARQVAALAAQGADAIEIWNEPNLDREYGGSGHGQVSSENYVDMLQKAYTAIKAANPGTTVIGGANAPTGYFGGNCSAAGCDDDQFLARMAAAGASNYMDCMGAHHNGSMVGPDQTSGAPTGIHYSWYFQGTFAVTYNAFGGRVPICWTELGYVTGEGIGALPSGFSWGSSTTLDNQAQWLARAVQLSRSSGKVRLMIIWNMDFRQWDADPQAGFSIFRPNGECRACGPLKAAMGR